MVDTQPPRLSTAAAHPLQSRTAESRDQSQLIVEGGAGPSRLLVRARLHRKGFTAVDTFQFNGDDGVVR
jgi:hypothetical protein